LRVVHRGAKQTPDRSVRLKRLPDGDDLDLNAVIDNAVEQRAGIAPDGRIFTRHGRRPKSTATIVLMDLSVSTDKFVPGSFTRVIDLEKQAAITVAEEMESETNRVAVHGFASNGRHEVNYYCVKDIDESFDNASRKRLERLTSNLSTRMGAALRHATTHLDQQMSDNKVILLLTDGEPSDVDVIEDDYLIEDAHNAVAAAAAKNVRTFCLTLDRRADNYVQRIFGDRSFFISDQASTFSDNAKMVLSRVLAP
jgi:nitric oxide reductase activation protein